MKRMLPFYYLRVRSLSFVDNQRTNGKRMNRVFISAGVAVAFIGTAIILPALADYGHRGPMADEQFGLV